MENTGSTEQKARNSFNNPYSCAQAVYAAFTEKPPEEILILMKENSEGRAEEGLCGALFAAHYLTDESKHQGLNNYFIKYAGGIHCKKIKKEVETSCAQCVILGVRAILSMR